MKFRLQREDHTRTYTAKQVAKLRRAQRRYKGFTIAALILVSLTAFHARAEEVSFSAPAPIQTRAETKPTHNFSVYDYMLYGGVVGYRVADYVTTQGFLRRGGHEAELPKSFVESKPGFMTYSLGMAALQIGGSVYLHKHGHAKLARVVDSVSISAGVATDWHNTYVARNKPVTTTNNTTGPAVVLGPHQMRMN